MKFSKIISSLLILVCTLTFYTHGMKRVIPSGTTITLPGGQVIQIIGDILLDNQNIRTLFTNPPFEFTELPPEIQHRIIQLLSVETTATSLETAAQMINNLAQVNKELNELINDSQFCLNVIFHLASKFECSHEEVAEALQTKEAKRRLAIQRKFRDIVAQKCTPYIQNTILNLCKNGALFNFIYVNEKYSGDIENSFEYFIHKYKTLLMYACPSCMKFLINIGAQINGTDRLGKTVLMQSILDASQDSAFDKVFLLLLHPQLKVNQQNIYGDTALHILIKSMEEGRVFMEDASAILKELLNAGADPQIRNKDGKTAFDLASSNAQIMNILKDVTRKTSSYDDI